MKLRNLVRRGPGALLALAVCVGGALAADSGANRIFFEIGHNKALVGGEVVQSDVLFG